MSVSNLVDLLVKDDVHIKCPICADIYTHQGKVEVFNRSEDSKEGNHVEIIGDLVKVNKDISANPSARRQGVSINMTCEGSQHPFTVDIYQHKGQTFFEVRY